MPCAAFEVFILTSPYPAPRSIEAEPLPFKGVVFAGFSAQVAVLDLAKSIQITGMGREAMKLLRKEQQLLL